MSTTLDDIKTVVC